VKAIANFLLRAKHWQIFLLLFVVPTIAEFSAAGLPLLGMLFCLLYSVSKNLVLAETRKPASFYEYAGPFVLLWFLPVGVWLVQPKVNRLYAKDRGTEALAATGVLER
jgi:hypothetical protein